MISKAKAKIFTFRAKDTLNQETPATSPCVRRMVPGAPVQISGAPPWTAANRHKYSTLTSATQV